MAASGGRDSFNNMVTSFLQQGKTVDEFVSVYKRIGELDAKSAADLSLQAFASPMMYSLQRVYAMTGVKVEELLTQYHAADIQRADFLTLSAISGEKQATLLDRYASEGGALREFNKLKSSLPLSEHELAKPLTGENSEG